MLPGTSGEYGLYSRCSGVSVGILGLWLSEELIEPLDSSVNSNSVWKRKSAKMQERAKQSFQLPAMESSCRTRLMRTVALGPRVNPSMSPEKFSFPSMCFGSGAH